MNEASTKEKTNDKEEYMDIIRNPITANGNNTNAQSAEITFQNTSFSFDTIDEGVKVAHQFEFTNTGQVSLVISNVQSTCGCTVPTWPDDPIAPGASSQITVEFDSEGKPKKQVKPITIIANTIPNKTVLTVEGFVNPKETEE